MAGTKTIFKTLPSKTTLTRTPPSLSAITASYTIPPPTSLRTFTSSTSRFHADDKTFATFKAWRDYTADFNARQPKRLKFQPKDTPPILVITLSEHHTQHHLSTIKAAITALSSSDAQTVVSSSASSPRSYWEERLHMCKSNRRFVYDDVFYFYSLGGGGLKEVMQRLRGMEGVEAVGVSRRALGCEGVDEDTWLALVERVEDMRVTERAEKVRAAMGRM